MVILLKRSIKSVIEIYLLDGYIICKDISAYLRLYYEFEFNRFFKNFGVWNFNLNNGFRII